MRISDWSSDVCSSDLPIADILIGRDVAALHAGLLKTRLTSLGIFLVIAGGIAAAALFMVARYIAAVRRREAAREEADSRMAAERETAEQARSDERHAGKACGGQCNIGWAPKL